MSAMPICATRGRPARRAVWAALLTLAVAAPAASAQDRLPPPTFLEPDGPTMLAPAGAAKGSTGVVPAGCSSCGGGVLGGAGLPPPSDDGCGSGCFPGRQPCCSCDGQCGLGRLFCGFYDCVCCPDPCYEPRWIAAANSAFFADSPRPVNQFMLRWDHGSNLILPDRSEYFWAREGGRGPARPESSVNYNQLNLYTEAAVDRFSFFISVPYLELDPTFNNHAAGWGDLTLGTKSVLVDCELLLVTFQFKTFIPTGTPNKGTGTGHVSLEPSILAAMKLFPDTYLQSQIAEWIPIGGDPNYQGSILHYHFSLNHVIARPVADTQLIGTLEFNGYSFQDGAYTDPLLGPYQKSSGYTYASIGPGLRYVICNKFDIGTGIAFSVTGQHFADQLYRTEFRWRF